MATNKEKQKKEQKKKRHSARQAVEKQMVGGGGLQHLAPLPKGVEVYKPKSGRRSLNVLLYKVGVGNPYADEDQEHYERTYYYHANLGANNERRVCPLKTANQPCPVCEFADRIRGNRKATDEDKKMADELRPKRRQLWVVNDPEEKEPLHVWETHYYRGFGEMLNEEINDEKNLEKGYEYFADPDDGFSIEVRFKDDTFQSRDYVKVDKIVGFEPRKSIDSKAMKLASTICLDSLIKVPTYKELEKLFHQGAVSDNGEDEKDEDESELEDPSELEEDSEVEEDSETEEPAKPAPVTAKSLNLVAGSEVTYTGGDKKLKKAKGLEITKISADGTSLTLEDEDGHVYKAIACNEVALIDDGDEDDDEDDSDLEEDEEDSEIEEDSELD